MLSDDIIKLCTPGGPTVTAALAEDPESPVHKIADKLYSKPNKLSEVLTRVSISKDHSAITKSEENKQLDDKELDSAASCGNFPYKPSGLFLHMFAAALRTLSRHPLSGMVSPPLMGSSGVIPLSVISVIPDIMKHYADVIVAAEHEVMLATNFWVASKSSKIITDAMRELSRRAEKRGRKVVFKLIYDRGNPKQVIENHIVVPEKEFTGDEVKIPAFSEVPGLALEVVNYHRPAVGTFHAKYMVVDRKVALLNSNNIQDRCNMEMMTHLEGPIVQSVYDMALLSWSIAMKPPLPLLGQAMPTVSGNYAFGKDNPYIRCKNIDGLDQIHPARQAAQPGTSAPSEQAQASLSTSERIRAITEHLNADLQPDTHGTLSENGEIEPFRPYIVHAKHEAFPMAMVNRAPHGRPGHGDTVNPQDAAWLAGFAFAKTSVFIQTPTFNAPPVVEACLAAVRRGIVCTLYLDLGFNDEGELLPYQGGTNEDVSEKMYKALNREDERERLRVFWYTGKDMKEPINASEQKRNCHVKLMIVDGAVGMQGNGNQDSQSWFHSQEINVMVDSEQICREWLDGIRANQNTHLYGQLALDGKWKDKDGNLLPGAHGANTGPFKSLKGVSGAIKRVQGKGGF